MEKTKLILIRHSETEWNRDMRIQGTLDSPLTEAGVRQAESLSRRAREWSISHAFSSDAERCLRTAQLVLQGTHLVVQPLKELRERDLGVWEGVSFPELKIREPERVQAYYDDPHFRPEKGESWFDMQSRVMTITQRLINDNAGKTIAIFTSGGPIKAILMGLFNIPPETWTSWRTGNTGVSILEWTRGRWRVNVFNDTSHLLK